MYVPPKTNLNISLHTGETTGSPSKIITLLKLLTTLTANIIIQWNPGLTICQGSSKIILLNREYYTEDR